MIGEQPSEDAASREFEALEGLARTLTASGQYRVIRKFRPRRRYADDPTARRKTALFVDIETTGLDTTKDAIIEFAGVPFDYSTTDGRIFDVGEPVSFLEDPKCPIPAEVTELTGITDEMVKGKRIDDAAVHDLLARTSLIVAHNAGFDRKMLERRLPIFEQTAWACSKDEVPWKHYGYRSTSLDSLLLSLCAEFFNGHRAAEDCLAGIHLLATRTPKGELPMRALLDSARARTMRVWALGSPIIVKDLLKSRGYSFHGGDAVRRKAWYRDIPADETDAEGEWLSANAYPGCAPQWKAEKHNAFTRYSARM
jgi:DNA polymerase III subunit epsilon